MHKEASMASGGKIKGLAEAGQGKSRKAEVAKRARLGVWKPGRPRIRLLVFLLFRKQWHFRQGNREAEWDCRGLQTTWRPETLTMVHKVKAGPRKITDNPYRSTHISRDSLHMPGQGWEAS